MPRRRINVSKLYELRAALAKRDRLREEAEYAAQLRFNLFHVKRWRAALNRAWWGYRGWKPLTQRQLSRVHRMVRVMQAERIL